jgi:FlaA1/EpsC-like NDP-sugar epimerase
MEEHPEEAVLVNVLGTRSLAGLAQEFGVERFVLISSDKAVAPQSIMGMTKRLGELLMVSLGKGQEGCRFTAVRFGNVLNSRGSVVPTFQWQLETGQPITVTDPRMKRFFMSSQEAVILILQAAALTQGGDIFLLDMGEELHVVDLAHRLIRLRGLRAGEDVEIRYTGMRPGEKLEEELFTPAFEERLPTENPYIFQIRSSLKVDREGILQEVDELVDLAWRGRAEELAARLRSRAAATVSVS